MFGLHFRRFNINVSAGKALGGSYWVHYSIGGGDATGDSALAAVLEFRDNILRKVPTASEIEMVGYHIKRGNFDPATTTIFSAKVNAGVILYLDIQVDSSGYVTLRYLDSTPPRR